MLKAVNERAGTELAPQRGKRGRRFYEDLSLRWRQPSSPIRGDLDLTPALPLGARRPGSEDGEREERRERASRACREGVGLLQEEGPHWPAPSRAFSAYRIGDGRDQGESLPGGPRVHLHQNEKGGYLDSHSRDPWPMPPSTSPDCG